MASSVNVPFGDTYFANQSEEQQLTMTAFAQFPWFSDGISALIPPLVLGGLQAAKLATHLYLPSKEEEKDWIPCPCR